MINTKTNIAGITLNSCVLNASGPNDATFEELEIIAHSGSGAVMMKSCTVEPREGNEEPRYVRLHLGSIQSMGLPNLGYKAYVDFASQLKKHGKPVIASIAGLSSDDYVEMMKAFQASEVDLIEVNLSCPNIEGKPQVAYDVEQTEDVLTKLSGLGGKPIGLKLPPFYDLVHQKQMAQLIQKHNIAFITCINSIGNTLVIDGETEAPVIKPKGGFGGLSGEYIKPVALANVRAFYELLDNKVSIFGVGGITTGADAFEFVLAGADAVQVGTTFEKEGPACFERIDKELKEILEQKGYDSIQAVKGNLKSL
ncbi:MAG TPA: dihydroorotate oxidase [Candidatus Wildermuthbacteria bacterium]|nr:dihydroorotate oxidase [Candidatus Wildermuthbacteria bacterium]